MTDVRRLYEAAQRLAQECSAQGYQCTVVVHRSLQFSEPPVVVTTLANARELRAVLGNLIALSILEGGGKLSDVADIASEDLRLTIEANREKEDNACPEDQSQ